MTLYCKPNWQIALQKQQLATFDQCWNYPISWIDTPNQNRGGWSGVGCVDVLFDGKLVTLFVKKQLNHTTRSLLHPIKGEPTFAKEFKVMQCLQEKNIKTPNVIFFAQRQTIEGLQAILITEKLEGYKALDEVTQQKSAMTLLQQRVLLADVAKTVRQMHQAGMQHRSLYAKHIFVKLNGSTFDVAMIDFEKSRRMVFPLLQSITDLITLNYRTAGWTYTSRLHFFKKYFGLKHLSAIYKKLVVWIHRKSELKLGLKYE